MAEIADQEKKKPNKLEHECFPQPTDTSTSVWRYIDIAKLISMLEVDALYLTRLNLFDDPYEGSLTHISAQARDEFFIRELGDTPQNRRMISQMAAHSKEMLKGFYVNCWNLGNHESEAMWKLYCGTSTGVAIRTSYSRLVAALDNDPNLYVGKVTYLDYEKQWFPPGNIYYPVMHKRVSFEHEREVRLVKTLSEYMMQGSPEGPPGISVPFHFADAIEAIYVNPYAPEYYFQAVRSVVRRMAPEFETKLVWSGLRRTPSY